MATELGIVNSALIKLGVETITALPGTTRQGALAEEQFDKNRDDLLMSHPWNFAMKRATLSATVNTPEFEFAYEYELPADCLRVWATQYDSEFYQVENGYLYSNYSDVKIRYIAQITDPASFSPKFSELLSLKMAVDLCYVLVQSNSLKQTLLAEYKEALRDIRSFDAQENPSYDLTNDIFINSRY